MESDNVEKRFEPDGEEESGCTVLNQNIN